MRQHIISTSLRITNKPPPSSSLHSSVSPALLRHHGNRNGSQRIHFSNLTGVEHQQEKQVEKHVIPVLNAANASASHHASTSSLSSSSSHSSSTFGPPKSTTNAKELNGATVTSTSAANSEVSGKDIAKNIMELSSGKEGDSEIMTGKLLRSRSQLNKNNNNSTTSSNTSVNAISTAGDSTAKSASTNTLVEAVTEGNVVVGKPSSSSASISTSIEVKGSERSSDMVTTTTTTETAEMVENKAENVLHHVTKKRIVIAPHMIDLEKATNRSILNTMTTSVTSFLAAIPRWTWKITKGTFSVLYQLITNPSIVKVWSKKAWDVTVHELKHYWVGFKLLGVEMKTSFGLARRAAIGYPLSRRERKQLVRSSADLARLVPFSVFVIVPFMEFTLPFFLKVFPNMLPSTFEDKLKREADMKKALRVKLELASFLQEMVQELETKVAKTEGVNIEDLYTFVEKTRKGEQLPKETLLRVAKLFNDQLTIDNMSRSQLVLLCRYMGLTAFGSDNWLRYQIINRINKLKQDDIQIYWEGVDSLNEMELRQACEERGMDYSGNIETLQKQLSGWIELSVHRSVPHSMLLLSRAFSLEARFAQHLKDPTDALTHAIRQIDDGVLSEAVRDAASKGEAVVPRGSLNQIILESVKSQNELIEEEREEREKQMEREKLKAVESSGSSKKSKTIEALSVNDSDTKPTEVKVIHDKINKIETKVNEAIEKVKDLKPEELEALQNLATTKSFVQSEKEKLEMLKDKIEQVEAAKALLSGRIRPSASTLVDSRASSTSNKDKSSEETKVSSSNDDKAKKQRASEALKKRVEKMLKSLETEISTAELQSKGRIKVLDEDRDGILSEKELVEAITQLLPGKYTPEEAKKIVEKLDIDKDGFVTVEYLIEVAKKYKDDQMKMQM